MPLFLCRRLVRLLRRLRRRGFLIVLRDAWFAVEQHDVCGDLCGSRSENAGNIAQQPIPLAIFRILDLCAVTCAVDVGFGQGSVWINCPLSCD